MARRRAAPAQRHGRLLVRVGQATVPLRDAIDQVRGVRGRRRELGGREPAVDVQGRALDQLGHVMEPALDQDSQESQIGSMITKINNDSGRH